MYLLQQPYAQFNGLDGLPLNNGYIYIGLVGSNPEVSPTTVYWDENLTIPASQPLRTINGYPARNGSPAKIYCATDAQMTVRDANGNLVYSDKAKLELDISNAKTVRREILDAGGLFLSTTAPASASINTGDVWIDTNYNENKWGVYRFDGTDNILTGVIDTSVNQFYPTNEVESTTVTPGTDADVTLTRLQYETGRIVLVDGAWTATHNVIFPDDKRVYYVDNTAGTYTATCKTAAGGVAQVGANSTAVLYCDGTDMVFASPQDLSADGVLCRHKNLVIKNNATNPTEQVDIDADELLLSGRKVIGVNLTIDITASGANGLDTGAEENSTWYHIWVIDNGTTTAGLLSTSATAPTMPSGYTYKGYVGAIYYKSGGDLLPISQVDTYVTIGEYLGADLSSGTATSYTAVTVTAPTTARKYYCTVSDGDNTGSLNARFASTSTPHGVKFITSTATGATAVTLSIPLEIILIEPSTIYYLMSSGDTGVSIYYAGWEY